MSEIFGYGDILHLPLKYNALSAIKNIQYFGDSCFGSVEKDGKEYQKSNFAVVLIRNNLNCRSSNIAVVIAQYLISTKLISDWKGNNLPQGSLHTLTSTKKD